MAVAQPASVLGRSQVMWVERVSQPSVTALASEAEAHGTRGGAERSVGGAPWVGRG